MARLFSDPSKQLRSPVKRTRESELERCAAMLSATAVADACHITPAITAPKLFTHLKIASAADAEVSVEEVDAFTRIMDEVGIANPSLQGKLGQGEMRRVPGPIGPSRQDHPCHSFAG